MKLYTLLMELLEAKTRDPYNRNVGGVARRRAAAAAATDTPAQPDASSTEKTAGTTRRRSNHHRLSQEEKDANKEARRLLKQQKKQEEEAARQKASAAMDNKFKKILKSSQFKSLVANAIQRYIAGMQQYPKSMDKLYRAAPTHLLDQILKYASRATPELTSMLSDEEDTTQNKYLQQILNMVMTTFDTKLEQNGIPPAQFKQEPDSRPDADKKEDKDEDEEGDDEEDVDLDDEGDDAEDGDGDEAPDTDATSSADKSEEQGSLSFGPPSQSEDEPNASTADNDDTTGDDDRQGEGTQKKQRMKVRGVKSFVDKEIKKIQGTKSTPRQQKTAVTKLLSAIGDQLHALNPSVERNAIDAYVADQYREQVQSALASTPTPDSKLDPSDSAPKSDSSADDRPPEANPPTPDSPKSKPDATPSASTRSPKKSTARHRGSTSRSVRPTKQTTAPDDSSGDVPDITIVTPTSPDAVPSTGEIPVVPLTPSPDQHQGDKRQGDRRQGDRRQGDRRQGSMTVPDMVPTPDVVAPIPVPTVSTTPSSPDLDDPSDREKWLRGSLRRAIDKAYPIGPSGERSSVFHEIKKYLEEQGLLHEKITLREFMKILNETTYGQTLIREVLYTEKQRVTNNVRARTVMHTTSPTISEDTVSRLQRLAGIRPPTD
jgi:hypothetical protein